MRLAVLANVQGNLSALQAILANIDDLGERVDRIVSAGDAVGIGPFPNEVLDTFQMRDVEPVLGNYEDALVFDRLNSGADFPDLEATRSDARALEWTRRQLSEARMNELRELPREWRVVGVGSAVRRRRLEDDDTSTARGFFTRMFLGSVLRSQVVRGKRVRVLHGSPRALNEFVRDDTAESILDVLARQAQVDVLISTHAGLGFKREYAGVTFVGVGSASGASARPGYAEYALVHFGEEVDVDFREVQYDASAYVRASKERGLPTPRWDWPELIGT